MTDVLKIGVSDLDWGCAPHVTDSGILAWLCTQHTGRDPNELETRSTMSRFLDLLQEQLDSSPGRFKAVAGAAAAIDAVRLAGWRVALATGGWRVSAALKLAAAGIDASDLAIATADDALTRRDIVEIAIYRATRANETFDRIVSIGDGAWDVITAASLGLPFIGIGVGSEAERLRSAGASIVFPNLVDQPRLLGALCHAEVPGAFA